MVYCFAPCTKRMKLKQLPWAIRLGRSHFALIVKAYSFLNIMSAPNVEKAIHLAFENIRKVLGHVVSVRSFVSLREIPRSGTGPAFLIHYVAVRPAYRRLRCFVRFG